LNPNPIEKVKQERDKIVGDIEVVHILTLIANKNKHLMYIEF
jgi:hypothetical protein